jgi:hypothetical protein
MQASHQLVACTSLTGHGGTDLFAPVLAAHDLSPANDGVDRVEDVVAKVGSRLGLAHCEQSADLFPDKDRESVLEVVLRVTGGRGSIRGERSRRSGGRRTSDSVRARAVATSELVKRPSMPCGPMKRWKLGVKRKGTGSP